MCIISVLVDTQVCDAHKCAHTLTLTRTHTYIRAHKARAHACDIFMHAVASPGLLNSLEVFAEISV